MTGEIVGSCWFCERWITSGEPMMAVNLDVEFRDRDGERVGVVSSEKAVTSCRECGKAMNCMGLRAALYDYYRG